MKVPIAVFLCFNIKVIYSVSIFEAEQCSVDQCVISNNCWCSSVQSPLQDGTAPQLISLTFDESVVDNLYTDLWEIILFNLTNPDGNPIGATFFVPHEYTDYSRVQDLYVHGFEIGVNSITKNSSSEYWSTASEETLQQEFGGQRVIISTFANISQDDIIGVRTPQLQIQGDVSINAYVASNLQYDSSMTARSTQLMFPYTLDYLSTQECRTGTTCPVESHPGFWVAPIIDLQGNGTDGGILECNSLTGCNVQGSAAEISSWLEQQVERLRSTNKAPLTMMVPSAWFRLTNNSQEGFQMFLNNILALGDVFLVTQKQVIDWMQNPLPADQFTTEVPQRTGQCLRISCPLMNTNNELRYMKSCVPCPEVYPWIGNPLGLYNPNVTTTTSSSATTTTTPTTTPTPTTPTPTTQTPTTTPADFN